MNIPTIVTKKIILMSFDPTDSISLPLSLQMRPSDESRLLINARDWTSIVILHRERNAPGAAIKSRSQVVHMWLFV
jgi:hypothetical protein